MYDRPPSRYFHPRRAVFGLPHNYGQRKTVEPESYNRRASPLFFHIHEIGSRYAGVALLLRSPFFAERQGDQGGWQDSSRSRGLDSTDGFPCWQQPAEDLALWLTISCIFPSDPCRSSWARHGARGTCGPALFCCRGWQGQLMAAVMHRGGHVLFPVVGTLAAPVDRMLAAILGQPSEQHAIGTLPNRFKASVPEAFDPAVAAGAARQEWRKLAECVWEQFVADVAASGRGTRAIWDRQIDCFWDMQWGNRSRSGRRERCRLARPAQELAVPLAINRRRRPPVRRWVTGRRFPDSFAAASGNGRQPSGAMCNGTRGGSTFGTASA